MPSAAVSRSEPPARQLRIPCSYLSSGAPVPDEPANSLCPSGSVTCPPLAVFDPFFAAQPSTMTTVPTGIEFLFHPRRIMEFGAASSMDQLLTWPCAFLTSMYIHE